MRSAPYSRDVSRYNEHGHEPVLKEHGVRHLFLDDSIGDKPDNPELSDAGGTAKKMTSNLGSQPFARKPDGKGCPFSDLTLHGNCSTVTLNGFQGEGKSQARTIRF